MSRRIAFAGVIVFAACWLAVAAIPTLRTIFSEQTTPWQDKVRYRLGMTRQFGDYEKQLDAQIKEKPNDLNLRVKKIESHLPGDSDTRKQQLKEYDALIARFPRESWLSLNRLRLSTSGGLTNMETGDPTPRLKSWLTTSEIEDVVRAAEVGAKNDPKNGFFDWMRAVALFNLKRPHEALAAMHEGAAKPRCDDGILAQTRLDDQPDSLWESRVSRWAAALFPHYGCLRESARAVIWQAHLVERKGDDKTAVQIRGDLMKLSATMRKDSSTFIELLVAQALQMVAWKGYEETQTETLKPSTESPEQRKVRMKSERIRQAAVFAAYARLHHRGDLANLAQREAAGFDNFELYEVMQNSGGVAGHRAEDIRFTQRLRWVSRVVLSQVLVCLCGFLLLSLARSKSKDGTRFTITPFDITSGLCFIVATCAVVFLIALRRGAISEEFQWLTVVMGTDPNTSEDQQEKFRMTVESFVTILTWAPLILAILYGFVAASWRARKSNEIGKTTAWSTSWNFVTILVALLLTAWLGYKWYAWATRFALSDLVSYGAVLLMLPAACGFIWLINRLRRCVPGAVLSAFIWTRSLLGTLVVVLSVAYLLCGVVALPARTRLNHQMDDLIQRGEVTVLRDMLKQQNTTSAKMKKDSG